MKKRKKVTVTCGTCKKRFTTPSLFGHWKKTGCSWGREVWVRVAQAKKRGHSGRRILSEAYPHSYPRRAMPEELIERFREMKEEGR